MFRVWQVNRDNLSLRQERRGVQEHWIHWYLYALLYFIFSKCIETYSIWPHQCIGKSTAHFCGSILSLQSLNLHVSHSNTWKLVVHYTCLGMGIQASKEIIVCPPLPRLVMTWHHLHRLTVLCLTTLHFLWPILITQFLKAFFLCLL